MDLQSEYNNPSQEQQAPADPSQGAAQDLTVPGAAVSQIVQAIQSQDCATLMKLLTQVISAGAQAPDSDNDGM